MRNITYENIVAYNLGATLYITMNYTTIPGQSDMHVYGITFRNITSYHAASPGSFICMPELPCYDIILDGVVHVGAAGEWVCENAYGSASGSSPASCLKQ